MQARRVDFKNLTSLLTQAGFIEAREEAHALIEAANGNVETLCRLATRRLNGEPLAWLTGSTCFLGNLVRVDRGVYVPRPQTEQLACRAIERLPDRGLAGDLATGCGAVAVALQNARPAARVLATDIDADVCRCARKNGVEVFQGHLGEPVPRDLFGCFDVVVAVVPYVPTGAIKFLPRDVRRYEPRRALDGGTTGLDLLEQVVRWGSILLHELGALIIELGGDQDEELLPTLSDAGFSVAGRLIDDDGDLRGVEAMRG